MNPHLQNILDILQQIENLSEEQKSVITKSLKDADKEMAITDFKLDRTEKVKRTTAILLEETIEELELKRKAVEETNLALQKSLEELKAAQTQLVQQEKLASLGQLTAGIAHEIKNPLNFVNNFSEVSMELIQEALEGLISIQARHALSPGDGLSQVQDLSPEHAVSQDHESLDDIKAILTDIQSNLTRIHQHGTRANAIVSSMLQHSRGGTGKMEPTNLNALIKEYINLAFHGMRAGKNPINVEMKFDLDEKLGEVNLIGEDFSRVILNLANNSFDAMREKSKSQADYKPVLSISSKRKSETVEISIADNGPGIPEDIKNKILQPFFTTKKGTEGTGLGLSITNDIIKAHGGEISFQSMVGDGSIFTIILPGERVP